MKEVCSFINVPLAENCEKKEKAFELETRGTVLGTGFDCNTMTWFLTQDKVDKLIRRYPELALLGVAEGVESTGGSEKGDMVCSTSHFLDWHIRQQLDRMLLHALHVQS